MILQSYYNKVLSIITIMKNKKTHCRICAKKVIDCLCFKKELIIYDHVKENEYKKGTEIVCVLLGIMFGLLFYHITNIVKLSIPKKVNTIKVSPLVTVTPKPSNKIIDKINELRRIADINELKYSNVLTKGAQERAEYMYRLGKLDHKGYQDAFAKAGYKNYLTIGENLSRNWSSEVVVQKWLESPRHAELIHNKNFKEIGIGEYKGYIVAWFGAEAGIFSKGRWTGYVSHYNRAGCLGCSDTLTMANGQPLDDNKPTIAFNWLPMNTRVRITNLSNGRSMIATVTDTGGFNSLGRMADLVPAVSDFLETKTDQSLVLIQEL